MLKKILAGAVSLTMAAVFCAATASAAKIKKGDIDGSGEVDIEDAVAVIGYVNGNQTLSDSALKAGDVDKNGAVDIEDAVNLLGSINGLSPLAEDVEKNASSPVSSTSIITAFFNADEEVIMYDVDAEYADDKWDTANDSYGEFGLYNSEGADTITFSAFCMSSDSMESKSVKELVDAHLPKMTLDGLDLVSEKETTFNGYDAYSLTYKFHFVYDDIDEMYTENFVFVKNGNKFMLVTYDYNSKDEAFALSKLQPVLDSVKFTDREAIDSIIYHRLCPFIDIMNYWGDQDEDMDSDTGYVQVFNADDIKGFDVSDYFDSRWISRCYNNLPGEPFANIYIAAKTSSDFASKSIKDIAKSEYPKLNIEKNATVEVLKEEQTKFNGYDAYHYDLDYKFDDEDDGVHEDCNVDVYFLKEGDTVLAVVTHLNNDHLEFLNGEIKPILDSIRFERHELGNHDHVGSRADDAED